MEKVRVADNLNYIVPQRGEIPVNCLLDTGNQRSYFSKDILRKLKCYDKISNPVDGQVKTYLGTSTKPLEPVVMKVGLRGKNYIYNSGQ